VIKNLDDQWFPFNRPARYGTPAAAAAGEPSSHYTHEDGIVSLLRLEVHVSDFSLSKLLFQGAISSGESVPSFHERLLDSLHDGVYFVDRERKIQYWNQGAEHLTGYTASEMVGRTCSDNLLMHVDEKGCLLCLNGCPLAGTILDGKRREAEIYLRHKLGHRVPVFVRASPITDSAGCIVGAVEVFSDASAKKSIERRVGELENLAFRDALTGVPNRRYAELKVKQAIQEVDEFGRSIGLLMIDIDHFKAVNDKHGHSTGDDALLAVCKTLTSNLRLGDTVGRWGGEEFLVINTDVTHSTLGASAERCRMLIAESAVLVGNERLRITASVGATLIKAGDSEQSAIKRADDLMYASKAAGRNQVTLG
jgi:diguanylate cyclase (GGDEF)-like protein/PAS domain S-box-containing protein